MSRYTSATDADRAEMLEAIGAGSIEELLVKIPAKVRLSRPLALPPALAETDLIHSPLPRARKILEVGSGARRCRRKFLSAFPGGFRDATYLDWERDYKWEAHQRWEQALGRRARVLRRSTGLERVRPVREPS